MRGKPMWAGRVAARLAIACLLASSVVHGQVTPTERQALPRLERVMIAEPPKSVADFVLTDQDGHAFAFSELRGKPALVLFGFAHCPDVCPAALAKLKRLHAQSELSARVQVVFISVDGERDTPEALKTWLARVSEDFVGLTGDSNLVRDIAASFGAAFFKDQPGPDDQGYLVEHSSQIYLVDADGNLRAEFYDSPVEVMATLTRAVLNEGGS